MNSIETIDQDSQEISGTFGFPDETQAVQADDGLTSEQIDTMEKEHAITEAVDALRWCFNRHGQIAMSRAISNALNFTTQRIIERDSVKRLVDSYGPARTNAALDRMLADMAGVQ
jgi:hypothetical protein